MKVLIIEDEAPAYRRLSKLIQECDSSAEVVGIIQSVKNGLEWFQTNPLPDLIFSDIQLADDLSFTIFKELNVTIPIIFITAYDEYAIRAFKFYSIDYLLKPINADDLKKSIDKYKTIQQKSQVNNFDELLSRLVQKKHRERFLVYSGDSLIPISWQDVAYFLSEDGVTMLVTNEDKRYFIAESLDTLEEELNPTDFFRANRQFIISSKSIQKIHNYGNQKLKLIIKPTTPDDIIISKLKATSFKSWLGQ
ncbi:MAG: response regulator transcription factor [Bacteroidales bacterium]|nr:response regulator transcription factor [Bacteroidales bacterium]